MIPRTWAPVLIVASLVIAIVLDLLFLRNYPISILYVIPVLVATYQYGPRVVAAIAGLSIALTLTSALLESVPPSIVVFHTLGVVLASVTILVIATLLARQREVLNRQAEVLAVARTEAERREQQLAEMQHLIAHDIRQPLTILLGQAQLLPRAVDAGRIEQARTSSGQIALAARRLDAMVRELVETARLERGQVQARREPIELASYIAEFLDRSREVLEIERVRVEATPVTVCADPNQLDRILGNLLSNAMKYSEPGTEIVLRIERRGNEARIAVTDRGTGIAPEDLPHLFERGFRGARHPPDAEGLGLGLYITRLLVEAAGGRIWAESELGRGSTFSVALPIARDAP